MHGLEATSRLFRIERVPTRTVSAAMMDPFSNAKDSIRGSAASLLGKERTWKDEVGDMCPSLTFTQVCQEIDRPLCTAFPSDRRPWLMRRMNTVLIARVSDCSDSGDSGSAARWASSSASVIH